MLTLSAAHIKSSTRKLYCEWVCFNDDEIEYNTLSIYKEW